MRKGGIPRARNKKDVPVCGRGHAMTPENTYVRRGREDNAECRECRRAAHKTVGRPPKPPRSSYHPAPHEPFMKIGGGTVY